MKTNKFKTLISLFVLVFTINSCVHDDDYSIPEISIDAPNLDELGSKTTFNAVVSRYLDAVSSGDQVGVFEFDAPLYIEGYVISSDRSGNFFEELIIQNSIDGNDVGSDPRQGFNVQINVSSLSDTYEVGRKIYVKLNGLAIGIKNGVYTLGRAVGNSLEQIQLFEYQSFIIRDPEIATLTPRIATIGDLTEQDENTLIQLNNMQVNRNILSKTFAGEPDDQFDGFRTLESCETSATILLQTSTFADFKSLPLPQNSGSIQGIYGRDFGDDFNVIIVNSADDLTFDNPERCDPLVLECDGAIGGNVVVYEQNFEGLTSLSGLLALGWEHFNIAGGVNFRIGSFSGNEYAQISGFSSGDNEIETWLVTPDINLDATTQEYLNFDLEVAYANGIILGVFITDNYTGDVSTTEWAQVDVNIPNVPTSGFGGFNNSGDINVSCLDGNIRVAFKYVGSDPSSTTRYHLDNFKVKGN